MVSNGDIEFPVLQTTIPSELIENWLPEVKEGVSQWSQVTAWFLTGCLAFASDKEKAEKEQLLKTFLFDQLKIQAQSSSAFIAYGDPGMKTIANAASKNIRNLLLGKNDKVENLPSGIDFTLSDVIKELTGKPLITVKNPEFGNMFLFQVTTNSFTGSVERAKDENSQVIPNKYVLFLAFPPRPVLNGFTVTDQQLYDWANNLNTGGNYLPPSPYIPIAGT